MLGGGCGAERGDRVLNPVLGQRHDVHIAFDHQNPRRTGAAPQNVVQPVQLATFMKNGGFRRIQVLGLALVDDSSAEAYAASAAVENRKNHAVPKSVVEAAVVPLHGEPGFNQLLAPGGV